VVQTPESGGFTEPALRTLFTRAFTPPPRKPTRIPPARAEANQKKLISIVVPVVVGILLLGILIGFFTIHRRKKQREQLLANPIGGGGNPAYPYMNEVGAPTSAGPVDHITAFQLPTTQSPATRNSHFPTLCPASGPNLGRSPFCQPEGGATPYGQYRGHSFIGLASPEGPMHLATLQPQELPGEYNTPTAVEKEGQIVSRIVMPSAELSDGMYGLGLAITEKSRHFRPISELEAQGGLWDAHANVSVPGHVPENFMRRSKGQITPLGAPPLPRKINPTKTVPSLHNVPVELTTQPNSTISDGVGRGIFENSNSENEAYPVLPTTPLRKSSRKSAHQTQEEREMLASGPYYPPTPSNDSDSLISMPTPMCETAGFARIVSPVAVVATNRMSIYQVDVSRSRTGKGGRPRPPVPAGVPLEGNNLEEGPGIRYDSEGVRMV